CGAGGFLELNVSMPLIAECLIESIQLLANSVAAFRGKCVEGIEANEERCGELIEYSLSMVTALAPKIGYDKASAIAKESVATKRTVREICEGRLGDLGISAAELRELLDPARMAGESV
ncbi:MAG TPA: aspartate ammonia-lyase, partial [Luteolibacter sp.]|nr:aspartate ammonia-lyase [Luteolibacter sp.]